MSYEYNGDIHASALFLAGKFYEKNLSVLLEQIQ